MLKWLQKVFRVANPAVSRLRAYGMTQVCLTQCMLGKEVQELAGPLFCACGKLKNFFGLDSPTEGGDIMRA